MKKKPLLMLGMVSALAVGVCGEHVGIAQAAGAGSQEASVSAAAANAAPSAPESSTQPAAIAAASVKYVQMQQADLVYAALFNSRDADKEVIAKSVAIVNRLLKSAKPSTEELTGEAAFFATGVGMALTDGTKISVEFKDSKQALIQIDKKKYMAQDAAAAKEFYGLLAVSPQSNVSTLKPTIGQTVRITGNDAGVDNGMVRIFVESPGSSGIYRTAKGIDYPSKRALLVYAAPYSEARYDFQFIMPAYGEASDGTFKPITPGKYEMYTDLGWHKSMHSVTVAPPSAPTLAINGVSVSEDGLTPIVSNGVMMLPMRALAESFGWSVKWDGAHKAAFVAMRPEQNTGKPEGTSELSLWVNGKQLSGTNAKPMIVKGSVYLPLRAITEAFGFQTTWTPSVRSVLLNFKPQLIDEKAYAKEAKKLAAVQVVNNYVKAMNGRDAAALERLLVKNSSAEQSFLFIGQRLITGISSVTFQDRPGGALLANVTFNYLFDPVGNKQGTSGIVLEQENGAWKITDVD